MSIDGAGEPVLELRDARFAYGKKEVLHGVTVKLGRGEVVALLGHNGAGKTTLLRLSAGLLRGSKTALYVDGTPMRSINALALTHRGVCYVEPQGVFPTMTIADHLRLAWSLRSGSGQARYDDRQDQVFGLFPELVAKRSVRASGLSGGQKQMLSLGCALMRDPRVLLVDEPLLGLAPVACRRVMAGITKVAKDEDIAVLLVEQNVELALKASQRTYVIRTGEIVQEAPSETLLRHGDYWSLV